MLHLTDTSQKISMSVPADMAFFPLATSFMEKAALAMGLDQSGALALTLATEEIFLYLCKVASPDQGVEIRCSGGGYYVRADFLFSVEDFNMRAFNLTATVSIDDEVSLEEMGLLIASRSVERFQVSEDRGKGARLTLIKEKNYPELNAESVPEVKPMPEFSVRSPDPEELKIFVILLNSHYPEQIIPNAFKYPGKIVDMVNGGEYQVALALAPGGQVGGGIVWHWAGLKTIECFGPYIFNQGQGSSMPEDLVEACLGDIAKTPAVGLLNRIPTHDIPQQYFEPLGTLTIFNSRSSVTSFTAYFRQLQEDPGAAVWSHPELETFLRTEYERLAFPREIRQVRDLGETKNPFSVLSAEFDRSQKMVTLRPIRPGADAEKNLVTHLKLIGREALSSIFFEMDLAEPWQTDFTPALLKNGFTPRMVLPYAGKGDIVIFQLSDTLL